jgi:hypothetical protein
MVLWRDSRKVSERVLVVITHAYTRTANGFTAYAANLSATASNYQRHWSDALMCPRHDDAQVERARVCVLDVNCIIHQKQGETRVRLSEHRRVILSVGLPIHRRQRASVCVLRQPGCAGSHRTQRWKRIVYKSVARCAHFCAQSDLNIR